jgi:ATP-dependent Clp protease adaptor protein ClpS
MPGSGKLKMSQVASMRGAMRLIRRRPIIEVAVDRRATGSLIFATAKRDGEHHLAPRPAVAGYRLKAMAEPPGTQTLPQIDVEEKLKSAFSRGWSVIVWNDPVNLMDYVVYVFKTVLKMNEKDASKHMWEVHQKGKSLVARETREKSELLVHRLRSFGLNATMEQEKS